MRTTSFPLKWFLVPIPTLLPLLSTPCCPLVTCILFSPQMSENIFVFLCLASSYLDMITSYVYVLFVMIVFPINKRRYYMSAKEETFWNLYWKHIWVAKLMNNYMDFKKECGFYFYHPVRNSRTYTSCRHICYIKSIKLLTVPSQPAEFSYHFILLDHI